MMSVVVQTAGLWVSLSVPPTQCDPGSAVPPGGGPGGGQVEGEVRRSRTLSPCHTE